jgi:hypothetical protein
MMYCSWQRNLQPDSIQVSLDWVYSIRTVCPALSDVSSTTYLITESSNFTMSATTIFKPLTIVVHSPRHSLNAFYFHSVIITILRHYCTVWVKFGENTPEPL